MKSFIYYFILASLYFSIGWNAKSCNASLNKIEENKKTLQELKLKDSPVDYANMEPGLIVYSKDKLSRYIVGSNSINPVAVFDSGKWKIRNADTALTLLVKNSLFMWSKYQKEHRELQQYKYREENSLFQFTAK